MRSELETGINIKIPGQVPVRYEGTYSEAVGAKNTKVP